jgi:hypothetical protein
VNANIISKYCPCSPLSVVYHQASSWALAFDTPIIGELVRQRCDIAAAVKRMEEKNRISWGCCASCRRPFIAIAIAVPAPKLEK